MAKKKSGKGTSKNDSLRGGKNTLPKRNDGTVDIKKVVKQGAQEQKKKWVDKKVVKDKILPKKSNTQAPRQAPVPQQVNGASRLKGITKVASKPSVKSQKKEVVSKGVLKLKAMTAKKMPIVKNPVRKAPAKGR